MTKITTIGLDLAKPPRRLKPTCHVRWVRRMLRPRQSNLTTLAAEF